MKQGDKIILTIRDLGMHGEGIARYGEHTVFVPFALPDEMVYVRVDHVKRNLAYATLIKVVTSSACRVAPLCNRYMRCGGCDLMHLDYADQLRAKTQQVATTLHKAKVMAKVSDCIPSPHQTAYRNKIMLPFGLVEGRVAVGFFREGTHRIVSLQRCPLHGDWAEQLIAVTLEYANAKGLTVYDEATGKGLLRHLVARHLGEHVDVTLVLNGHELPEWQAYRRALSDVFDDFTLYVSPNTVRNNVIMGNTVRLLYGTPYVHDVMGVSVSINPLSFLQVNDDVCHAIYRQVVESLHPLSGRTVIDAFAGVGVLGAIMAKEGADVYNIEIVPEATCDADRLAETNHIPVHNLCGDSAVVLPEVLAAIGDMAPAVHDMHLLRPYFDAIAAGRKTYELRLMDDKRRRIKEGDLVRFTCEDDVLYCRVCSLHTYADFAALFADLGTRSTCAEPISTEDAADSMSSIYSTEQQALYGALAIEVRPVNVAGVAVVLDPPRKGCPTNVVESLTALGQAYYQGLHALHDDAWQIVCLPYIDQIVYISCNPATLARDLAGLASAYTIDSVQPYDMFPQTRHVETLVLMSRGELQS